MRRINYPLYYFVQLTWGILQNILGFLLYLFLILIKPDRPRTRFNGSFVTRWKGDYSASIGMFIFLGDMPKHLFERVLSHEYGHTIQSCILGPLYLFVIGIPSYIWAHKKSFITKRTRGIYHYSDFYPEKWANYLGRKYTGLEPINN